ncbi:hypothetical protein QQX98_012109 [Neonectria punicea]|uniref:Uncharacterized protein n=1 Tax=Neonectria punicea TaxID=979145 RepID=A0ABR1GJR5_9HYPO
MTIPEIMFDASLLLSPHVLRLGKLFRHEAFENPSFTTPDSLSKLDIYFDEYELPIPLKKSMFDTYVFRDTIKTALDGYVISENKNITYAMMAKWTRVIGEIVGFIITVILYTLRYNAANEFDQSPNISDGLRNLILGHADSDPFRRHYLGRVVNVDTMAVVRHKPQQQALMRQATSVGCSVSKRRPTELTAEQSSAVNDDPRVQKLLQRQRILRIKAKRSHKAQQQLDVINKELIGERARLRRERKRQIRKDWSREQAVKDIERQLAGKPLERPHESSPAMGEEFHGACSTSIFRGHPMSCSERIRDVDEENDYQPSEGFDDEDQYRTTIKKRKRRVQKVNGESGKTRGEQTKEQTKKKRKMR